MAIQISGNKVKQLAVQDHVFVRRIEIVQRREREDALPSVYDVDVTYQLYGVGSDGLRYYNDEVHAITIKDFLSSTKDKPKQNVVMAAIEDAVADMLAEQAEIDAATVV